MVHKFKQKVQNKYNIHNTVANVVPYQPMFSSRTNHLTILLAN